MIGSGLLLQAKKHWAWVQPVERRGTGTVPAIDLEGILTSLKTFPEMNVMSWSDVNRLDVRPGRGMVKPWLMDGYEVQVDLGTGRGPDDVAAVVERSLDVVGAVCCKAASCLHETPAEKDRLMRYRFTAGAKTAADSSVSLRPATREWSQEAV
jgi:hypothetical protein